MHVRMFLFGCMFLITFILFLKVIADRRLIDYLFVGVFHLVAELFATFDVNFVGFFYFHCQVCVVYSANQSAIQVSSFALFLFRFLAPDFSF